MFEFIAAAFIALGSTGGDLPSYATCETVDKGGYSNFADPTCVRGELYGYPSGDDGDEQSRREALQD